MPAVQAAVGLDRTRLIFPGESNSVSLNVNNGDDQRPFLAQGWIEDLKGNKGEQPFVVLPPIQRLEPSGRSQVKVQKLPTVSSLPQHKESLFYFVMQEIPPKGEEENMLQIAIQNRIKFMYRPASLAQSAEDVDQIWANTISLKKAGLQAKIHNASPYYLTLLNVEVGETGQAIDDFQAVLVPPFDSVQVPLDGRRLGARPVLKYINDYGGIGSIALRCDGTQCNPVKVVS